MEKNKIDANLISALANIEIEEFAIEDRVQNAFNLKEDSLKMSKDSKKTHNKSDS